MGALGRGWGRGVTEGTRGCLAPLTGESLCFLVDGSQSLNSPKPGSPEYPRETEAWRNSTYRGREGVSRA